MSNSETMPNLREIPEYFEGKGEVRHYTFTQVKKSEKGYIYEVQREGLKHYEVFERHPNTRFGIYSYPGSASFGHWAWTFNTLEMAMHKFNQL